MWYASLVTLAYLVTDIQAAVRSSASATYYGKHRTPATASNRVEAAPGEFPFFSQWGGCAATLIWEDVLLTSAAVSAMDVLRKSGIPFSQSCILTLPFFFLLQ